jgi:hypothetical protein
MEADASARDSDDGKDFSFDQLFDESRGNPKLGGKLLLAQVGRIGSSGGRL